MRISDGNQNRRHSRTGSAMNKSTNARNSYFHQTGGVVVVGRGWAFTVYGLFILRFTAHSIFRVKQGGGDGAHPAAGLLRQPPPPRPLQFHRPGPVCECSRCQPGLKLKR